MGCCGGGDGGRGALKVRLKIWWRGNVVSFAGDRKRHLSNLSRTSNKYLVFLKQQAELSSCVRLEVAVPGSRP